MPKQYRFKPGPQNVPTNNGHGKNAMRRIISAATISGVTKPAQTRGAGISPSPTISAVSGYTSRSQDTNVGSGTRNRASSYPVGASAPQEARTLTRAPAGWLK